MVALNASSPVYVRDLMSHEVTSVRRNDRLSLVDDVMRLGRIRHLPVVDDDDETKIVGLVSLRDLPRFARARARLRLAGAAEAA